jgi:hypothetical protein
MELEELVSVELHGKCVDCNQGDKLVEDYVQLEGVAGIDCIQYQNPDENVALNSRLLH